MMNANKRLQTIRQSAVAKAALKRMQAFIEAGGCKVNESQLRFDDLQIIFGRYETAQIELDLSDNTDHTGSREAFGKQYCDVKANFSEVYFQ